MTIFICRYKYLKKLGSAVSPACALGGSKMKYDIRPMDGWMDGLSVGSSIPARGPQDGPNINLYTKIGVKNAKTSLQSPKTEFGLHNQYGHVTYPSIGNFIWMRKTCTVGSQKGENKPSEPKNGN
jgi:hypothetical protein